MTKEEVLKQQDIIRGDEIKEEKVRFVMIAKEVIEKLQKRIDLINKNLDDPEIVFPSNLHSEVELVDWEQLQRSAQFINNKAYALANMKRVISMVD